MVDTALATDPAAIERAVRDEPVGTTWPWNSGPKAIEAFLHRVVDAMNGMRELCVVEAEFGHYGSGYASFVDVFLTKRDGSLRETFADGWTRFTGWTLALCRLAPFAVLFGNSRVWYGPRPGTRSSSIPHRDRLPEDTVPASRTELWELAELLEGYGFAFLDPEILMLPIDPTLEIDTTLGERPYRVWDAWFHWAD